MGKRRRAREAAIQYHFWRDLQHGVGPERMEDFWEFLPAKTRVREFAQPLIDGMNAHLEEIDDRIRRYEEQGVSRGVVQLAPERADKTLPLLDRWAELIRRLGQ